MATVKREKRPLWSSPWGYRESFLFAFQLLIIGMTIEIISGEKGVGGFSWPINLFSIIAYVVLIFVIYFSSKKSSFFRWMSSLQVSVSAIVLMGLLVLMMGMITQDNSANRPFILRMTGFSHVKSSYPFLFSQVYLVTALSFVILKRIQGKMNKRNIAFLVNHVGLWMVLVFGYAGSGDISRLSLYIYENKSFNNLAINNETKELLKIPFELKLLDFSIIPYPSKLGVYKVKENKYINLDIEMNRFSNFNKVKYNNWIIHPRYYLPNAQKTGDGFVESKKEGSVPALNLVVKQDDKNLSYSAWLSPGNYRVSPEYLSLDKNNILYLSDPEVKSYISKVVLKDNEEIKDTVTIEVNKPLAYKGWKIYQSSYDNEKGKWSDVSILELVKDPWLPFVYLGIFLLIAGSFYLIWVGKRE